MVRAAPDEGEPDVRLDRPAGQDVIERFDGDFSALAEIVAALLPVFGEMNGGIFVAEDGDHQIIGDAKLAGQDAHVNTAPDHVVQDDQAVGAVL